MIIFNAFTLVGVAWMGSGQRERGYLLSGPQGAGNHPKPLAMESYSMLAAFYGCAGNGLRKRRSSDYGGLDET